MRACMRAFMRAYVRAFMRECMRGCMRACIHAWMQRCIAACVITIRLNEMESVFNVERATAAWTFKKRGMCYVLAKRVKGNDGK